LLHVDRLTQFLSMLPGFYDAISAPKQPARQKQDHPERQIEYRLEIWILRRVIAAERGACGFDGTLKRRSKSWEQTDKIYVWWRVLNEQGAW
jgi:hypothetical protein